MSIEHDEDAAGCVGRDEVGAGRVGNRGRDYAG